jgi:hypothetical protein
MGGSIIEIMDARFSCRDYDGEPIPTEALSALQRKIDSLKTGPFGSSPRFALVAAKPGDASELKGLVTYGFIKNPSAFLLGAAEDGGLEDFGYLMEEIVLEATALGLGSCWLGGTFRRSGFEKALAAKVGVDWPLCCAISLGNIPKSADPRAGFVRARVGGISRKPWEELFFEGDFGTPLGEAYARDRLGPWVRALEAVRRGPSASNKQPWRIVKYGPENAPAFRLYLARTPGYRSGFLMRTMRVADIQRVDMGIAMAHFSLAAAELGLVGKWIKEVSPPPAGRQGLEYVASWNSGVHHSDSLSALIPG